MNAARAVETNQRHRTPRACQKLFKRLSVAAGKNILEKHHAPLSATGTGWPTTAAREPASDLRDVRPARSSDECHRRHRTWSGRRPGSVGRPNRDPLCREAVDILLGGGRPCTLRCQKEKIVPARGSPITSRRDGVFLEA
jgi:hypothetical protein